MVKVVLLRRIFELCAFLLSVEIDDFFGDGELEEESKNKMYSMGDIQAIEFL